MSKNIERKRSAKRQRILETGAKIFAQKGYHATRMQDIADELDLQKGSLYYYYPSKEAILFNVLEEELEHALSEISEILASSDPPLVKIETAVTTHLISFHRYPDIYSIYIFEKLNIINQDSAKKIDALGRAIEATWHQLLQMGIDSAVLKSDLDIAIATKAILGMSNMTLIWFNDDGPSSIQDIATKFVDYILNGLKQ